MRVAIVNDLALAREVLRRLVLSVPGYTIAWTACDGAEAVRKAAADRPDVILMDLIMPVLDGVEATRRIMAENPCPILLVTSSISSNFSKVYEAMGHGGLDAVNTPTLDRAGKVRDGEGLLARLANLAKSGRAPAASIASCLPVVRPVGKGPPLVALGASTGGPEALACIVETFPADFPAAVVIVQHIGADFAPSLVLWLQERRASPRASGERRGYTRAGRNTVGRQQRPFDSRKGSSSALHARSGRLSVSALGRRAVLQSRSPLAEARSSGAADRDGNRRRARTAGVATGRLVHVGPGPDEQRGLRHAASRRSTRSRL